MEIGNKIRNARIESKLTQEQAAEALGVSRQTISNWENEKSYPDIISVVKMSDLYSVSLDYLLKEENPMSKYMNYLKDSTDIVKSRKKLSKLILIITYLVIWAFSLVVFWFFTDGGDAMGYWLMFLIILLPVTTFVISFLIGKADHWGKLKWLAPIFFGTMYMLAEYATFSVANMASNDFNKLNIPHFMMIFYGAVVSVIGLAIGDIVRLLLKNKTKNS